MKKLLLSIVILILLISCNNSNEENAKKDEATTEAPKEEMLKEEEMSKGEMNKEEMSKEDEEMSKEDKVIRYNISSDPKTIDPQLNSAVDGSTVVKNIYEGLLRESNGEYIPGIAESYEISEDGLVYTFKLRDAKWTDGKEVTAEDFIYSWKRAMDPINAAEYAFQMEYIKGAEEAFKGGNLDDVGLKAIDDKTLEVTLESPTAYFHTLVTTTPYFPVRKDAVETGENWARDPKTVISNGPFKLVEYKSGERIVVEKNENYWNASDVKLDRVEMYMIVDDNASLTAYQNNEIDITDARLPAQEIPRLMAEDPDLKILPQLGVYYYYFNNAVEPLSNIDVRKALTYSVDRTAIVERVTKLGQSPASGFVPSGLKDSTGGEFREKAGDYGIPEDLSKADEAKSLLEKAGFPNGEGFPELSLVYNTSESHKAVAEAIQEMWKTNLGINVKLTNQEWAVFQETRHQGTFDIARAGWIGDYPDPMTFLDLFLSTNKNNNSGWKSEEYDKVIEKARLSSGAERDTFLLEAEKILADQMIILPLYYYTHVSMIRDTIIDVDYSILGGYYFGKTDIK